MKYFNITNNVVDYKSILPTKYKRFIMFNVYKLVMFMILHVIKCTFESFVPII